MNEAKLIRARAVTSEHEQGMTIKAIAQKYKITERTVRNYLDEGKKLTAEKKAERNRERRASIEERQALSNTRKEKVKEDIKAGMTMQEAAAKEGLNYGTVTSYIRGENIPTDITYKETIRTGTYKKDLLEWAKRKSGGTIKTPEGEMTMLRIYPHIVECAKQYAKGYIITTFTLAEVYYMNQGG